MAGDQRRLRECPTCSTPLAETVELGFRDFAWVHGAFPGKVGPMDVDFFLRSKDSKRGLAVEFKPGKRRRLSLGQYWSLKLLAQKGIEVWVIWGDFPGRVVAAELTASGTYGQESKLTVDQLAKRLRQWWEGATARQTDNQPKGTT